MLAASQTEVVGSTSAVSRDLEAMSAVLRDLQEKHSRHSFWRDFFCDFEVVLMAQSEGKDYEDSLSTENYNQNKFQWLESRMRSSAPS